MADKLVLLSRILGGSAAYTLYSRIAPHVDEIITQVQAFTPDVLDGAAYSLEHLIHPLAFVAPAAILAPLWRIRDIGDILEEAEQIGDAVDALPAQYLCDELGDAGVFNHDIQTYIDQVNVDSNIKGFFTTSIRSTTWHSLIMLPVIFNSFAVSYLFTHRNHRDQDASYKLVALPFALTMGSAGRIISDLLQNQRYDGAHRFFLYAMARKSRHAVEEVDGVATTIISRSLSLLLQVAHFPQREQSLATYLLPPYPKSDLIPHEDIMATFYPDAKIGSRSTSPPDPGKDCGMSPWKSGA